MKTYEIDYNDNYIILSDIHGNYHALEACLIDAFNNYGKTIKGFIFLGDYCCDYPGGNKVMEMIFHLMQKFPCYLIAGNREMGMVRHFYTKTKDTKEPIDLKSAEKLTGWNLDTSMGCPLVDCVKLSKYQLEFLAKLPETTILKNKKQTILLKHKMPLSKDELAFLKEESTKEVDTMDGTIKREIIVLSGHTHYISDGKYDFIRQISFGAVGLSNSGLPGAYYGILNHGKLLTKHIDYDYQKAIEDLNKETILFEKCANWGEFLSSSITSGLNTTALYANEYQRLYEEFENLEESQAKSFISLTEEEQLVVGKILFPSLYMEQEKQFRGSYGNTNPFGYYVEADVFEYEQTNDRMIPTKRYLQSDEIIPPKRKAKNNNVPIPKKILDKLAKEYTYQYVEYITTHGPQFYINKTKWK